MNRRRRTRSSVVVPRDPAADPPMALGVALAQGDPLMPVFFSDEQFRVVEAACARLIPTDSDPGAVEAGVADYIDGFLGAFRFDPPRIWAGGGGSGRFGGAATFGAFRRLAGR